MNIKTRLLNEELFGYQPYIGERRAIALNIKGIFTIEDFINCDVFTLATNSYLRNYYLALQHVLKYKYLGTPLVNDILLDTVYRVDREKCKSNCEFVIYNAKKLGFDYKKFSKVAKEILDLKVAENSDYHPFNPDENGFSNYWCYELPTIEILQKLADGGDKLAQFYVSYQNKKKYYEEKTLEAKQEAIFKLKCEMTALLMDRDEINEKIHQVKEQLKDLERDNINGRK